MNARIGYCAMVAGTLVVLLVSGCDRSQGGNVPPSSGSGIPAEDTVNAVPLGQVAGSTLVAKPELSIANPYAGDPQAIEQGHALYLKMNCAGCHAYGGTGNMGPSFTDKSWRYGGYPIQIYQSIRDGRPQGMPSWGTALPPQDIWRLVAYIESLGGAFAPPNEARTLQSDQTNEQVAPELKVTAHPTPENTRPVSVDAHAASPAAASGAAPDSNPNVQGTPAPPMPSSNVSNAAKTASQSSAPSAAPKP